MITLVTLKSDQSWCNEALLKLVHCLEIPLKWGMWPKGFSLHLGHLPIFHLWLDSIFSENSRWLWNKREHKRGPIWWNLAQGILNFFYRQNILLSDFEYFFVLPKWNWLDTHRHSRFGGTYVVQNMKSISDRDVIFHKNQKDVSNLTFDINKKPKKRPKNRQPIKDQEVTRRSTLSIRLGLKEFCTQFLESCYNPLMYAVKVQTAKLSFLSLDVTVKKSMVTTYK